MWTGSSERAQPRPLPSQKKMGVLVGGIFIWVFDAVGGVVVNGIITLVKG